MQKTLAVLLALFCIAGFLPGFALAEEIVDDRIEEEIMLIGMPTEMTVYHPLSMLLTDTEADKLQAFDEIVWLPVNDGAPAGFYYPKVLSVTAIPDGMSYSSFWEPEQ